MGLCENPANGLVTGDWSFVTAHFFGLNQVYVFATDGVQIKDGELFGTSNEAVIRVYSILTNIIDLSKSD